MCLSLVHIYQMWQYTSKGSVPGISGNVDMNVAYFKYTGTPDASVTNVKFVVKDNSGKAVKGATVQLSLIHIFCSSNGWLTATALW